MKFPNAINNDKKTLGLLGLVIVLVVALPWLLQSDDSGSQTTQAQQSGADSKNAAHSNGVRGPRAFRGKRQMDWTAQVDYVANTGSIEVDLRHKDIPIDNKLKVHANFKAPRAQRSAESRWLSRQANGVYRAGDVHLRPGKWTMGLTGYRLSKLAFRLEQILDVK